MLVFVLFLGFLGIRYAYMHTYAKFGLLSLHVSRNVRGHDSWVFCAFAPRLLSSSSQKGVNL